MPTNTLEQIERDKEIMRLIQTPQHEEYLKTQEEIFKLRQEILARTPKRKIYFGKVKTE